jgi:hypothetical protein
MHGKAAATGRAASRECAPAGQPRYADGTSAPGFLPDALRRTGVRLRKRYKDNFPGQPGHEKAPWTIGQDHPGGKAPALGTHYET